MFLMGRYQVGDRLAYESINQSTQEGGEGGGGGGGGRENW